MEIGSQIKISRPKTLWSRAFSIVKMLPREVTIFQKKKIINKISDFSFQILQINAKYTDMLK